MFPYGTYSKYDNDSISGDSIEKDKQIWTICERNEKVYSYDEAIEMAGNGCYNLGLLAATFLSMLAVILDMFSFSTVVAFCRCDLQIDMQQTTILISIPFIGSITMAYAWGYISDTKGRRYSLLIAMGCSFIMSVLCAFAPNAIVLGVFKLIGTCFCSCAQSVPYALLGESCSARVRSNYLLIMTSGIFFTLPLYLTPAYLISYLDFSFDLIFIKFVPWRLLVLILALPLGVSAFSLIFFYESPKFLLNVDKKEEALEILKKIYRRNGLEDREYPVKKLSFNSTISHNKNIRFLQSLWAQTAPLFKPPLLWKTLILYYYTIVIYSTSSAIYVWLPFLTKSFTHGFSNEGHGFCSLIGNSSSTDGDNGNDCTSIVGLPIVILGMLTGVVYFACGIVIAKLSSRKKTVSIVVLIIAALSSAGILVFNNNIFNVVIFFGIALSMQNVGIVSSYYVDLFPTSYLGMASCLGMMVARLSSIVGVNWMGPLMMTHCTAVFSFWACYLLSAALVSCALPPDKINSNKNNEFNPNTLSEEKNRSSTRN